MPGRVLFVACQQISELGLARVLVVPALDRVPEVALVVIGVVLDGDIVNRNGEITNDYRPGVVLVHVSTVGHRGNLGYLN